MDVSQDLKSYKGYGVFWSRKQAGPQDSPDCNIIVAIVLIGTVFPIASSKHFILSWVCSHVTSRKINTLIIAGGFTDDGACSVPFQDGLQQDVPC